jgi:hypothetical protein
MDESSAKRSWLRNYLAGALRNLARNALYSGINVLGLSAALAAALFIGLNVRLRPGPVEPTLQQIDALWGRFSQRQPPVRRRRDQNQIRGHHPAVSSSVG